MAKNIDLVNAKHEEIFDKYGLDLLSIPFALILVYDRLFSSSYVFKQSYISFLKRENGIEIDPRTGRVNTSKRCRKCGEKIKNYTDSRVKTFAKIA